LTTERDLIGNLLTPDENSNEEDLVLRPELPLKVQQIQLPIQMPLMKEEQEGKVTETET
jgi:hypothetical protein